MRAVRFDEYGDIDVLKVVEVDTPEPGPGELLVRVKAAGINPGESMIRRGALADRWPATFPEGEGSDFAGVIEGVGAGVTVFSAGDEVFGFTDDRASHAEYVLARTNQVVPKPAAVSWEVAGGLFIAGTSAYVLVDSVGLEAEDVVVVSGAAGGVGSLTVQWATNTGATVIGLAGAANHEWLTEHGVTPVDYAGEDLVARIQAAAGRTPVTALLDTYGPPYVQLGIDLGVEPRRIASIADFGAASVGAQSVLHSSVARPEVLTELIDAVAAGRLEVPIAATYPLADVQQAYRVLEARHTRGKIVLIP